jgi:hypothetical protein
MKNTEKTFDCIAFKRTAQLRIYEEIKNMSRDEELAYFHSKAESGPFKEWWLRQKNHKTHTPCCAETGVAYEQAAAHCAEGSTEYKGLAVEHNELTVNK